MLTKVEKKNKEFTKLTKPQQRIRIAQDVIKHLNTAKITAESGVYFDLDLVQPRKNQVREVIKKGISLQELIQSEKAESCRTCALGGLFFSAVYRANQYNTKEDVVPGVALHICGKDAKDNLSNYFSHKQLAFIESAFEEIPMNYGIPREVKMNGKSLQKAADYFNDDPNLPSRTTEADDYKLRNIMKNVIKNGGTFKF